MRLIAKGRASEIYDLGDGRVLRRSRAAGDPAAEALVMEHARACGYPVPRVDEVRQDALVLERVDGPTMLADLGRRPWKLARHARLLGRLHDRLHEIAAPPSLREVSSGGRLLHLDLHPGNVILAARGPVVIDWTNAGRGDPATDVALSWVILATAAGWRGRLFAARFMHAFDRDGVVPALPGAAALRLADPNVREAERDAICRLAARAGAAT